MSMTFSSQLLTAGSASSLGRRVEITKLRQFSMSLNVTVTAPTLQATFALRGSDFDTLGTDAVIISGTPVSALPGTITYDATTGVLTLNNPAAGTHTWLVSWWFLPKWIQPDWTYISGGGDVAVSCMFSGWS